MKRNSEFYRAVVVFSEPFSNRFRCYESNTFDDTLKAFEKMEKSLKEKNIANWSLTFEKHLPKNQIQIIKIRSSSEKVDSPLF